MIVDLIVGLHIRKTHISFSNNNDYEAYINAKDMDYDSETCILTGFVYKLDTPVFNKRTNRDLGKS